MQRDDIVFGQTDDRLKPLLVRNQRLFTIVFAAQVHFGRQLVNIVDRYSAGVVLDLQHFVLDQRHRIPIKRDKNGCYDGNHHHKKAGCDRR